MADLEKRSLTPLRIAGAVAAGLFLAGLPLARFVFVAGHAAHTDHTPRHGGQLGMSGDHHLEVRRAEGRIEVFPSDAYRRPVAAAEAWAAFDEAAPVRLRSAGDRLIGEDVVDAREIEAIVVLEDGTRLQIRFDFGDGR